VARHIWNPALEASFILCVVTPRLLGIDA